MDVALEFFTNKFFTKLIKLIPLFTKTGGVRLRLADMFFRANAGGKTAFRKSSSVRNLECPGCADLAFSVNSKNIYCVLK